MSGVGQGYNSTDDTHDMSEQPNETSFITISTSYCLDLDSTHVCQDYCKGEGEYLWQL